MSEFEISTRSIYGVDDLLELRQVAARLRMSPVIIRKRLIDTGLLPCYVLPGGELRFEREDVEKMLHAHRFTRAGHCSLDDVLELSRIESRFENLRRDLQQFDEYLNRKAKARED